ncbi:hypothetical protein [Paenibacillus sp. BIC5C1]|uniref:hypothetical protein n=1 Tax=Paenibacillus sp. BIC5C1 TaxID=3078263 RepID=UPI0028F01EC7|nr:hypothetical protein [Paenibacillus sp. BIC5C1]
MQSSGEYINQLFDMTIRIVDQIDDIEYEELTSFVDQRESLVGLIMSNNSKLDEFDKNKVKQLMKYDDVFLNKMLSLKNEAASWLNKQGSIRVQKNAYSSNYASDSLFFDRKN